MRKTSITTNSHRCQKKRSRHMTRQHKYQALFWNAISITAFAYSMLAFLLKMQIDFPPALSTLYNWILLPSIIVYGLASRAVEKIKVSHPEIPESRWKTLEHYPNPLKNTFINWCFAIWLFLIICSGPLYLWFVTTERHQCNTVLGIVFFALIEIAWIFFFGHHLLYTYHFLGQADQLVEEYKK